MSFLGRFLKYSDCLYKQRLNVVFGRNQTFPAISSDALKRKGYPEGWPLLQPSPGIAKSLT